MVPPPPALPPPSNTPSGPANAAALWRMRYAAATPSAKVPPTYAGSRINAGRHGDETRTGSTRDDETRTWSTRNDETRTGSTGEDETRARSTRNDEIRNRSMRDDEARTRSTRDNETRTRSTRDDETRTRSTRDDEARTRSTRDDESRTRSTRDAETGNRSPRDDETRNGSTRGDIGARRSDRRDKVESWYRDVAALRRQYGDSDEDPRRESEMKSRDSAGRKDGGLLRAGVRLFEKEDEDRLSDAGEDMMKCRSEQDLGRGKPDIRKRRTQRDLDDCAGSKEMTYAARSRDDMAYEETRRNEMAYAGSSRNELAYAGSSRNELAYAGSSHDEIAHSAPSRREMTYAQASPHESVYAAPGRKELAYAAPCRAEIPYSAPSRNEMAYEEPSRFDYGQDQTLRDDKYAQDDEDDRWRDEMRDAEKPRLEEVHEVAGDWRCRDKGQGSSTAGENSRDGSRETVVTLPHDSPEVECKDVNEVSRRMDSALERSMRSRREAADVALTSARDATNIVGEAATPTHNPFRPTCFDVRTIPFALRKLHKFIFSPAPAGGGVVIRCFIERNRSGSNALFPVYKLYTDHEDGTGRFVMAARKVRATRTPHYVFSTSTADVYKQRSARGRNYLGKLRGNGATSSYVLYDKGEKPTILHSGRPPAHSNSAGGDEKKTRCEFAAISFSPRRGRRSSNPRHMEVALPQVRWRLRKPSDHSRNENDDFDDGGIVTRQTIRPAFEHEGLEHMLTLIQGQGAQNVLYADRIAVCHLRKTRYDPLSSCLVDFKARASVASIKNFQLVKSPPLEEVMQRNYYATGGEGEHLNREQDANQQPVLVQMGKVGRNCFNMDYQFPFSMFQAFAICIARFDTRVDF